MNVTFPEMDITGGSFVVQWDTVMDYFNVTYTVRWRGEDGTVGYAIVQSGLSYTITRLTNTHLTMLVLLLLTLVVELDHIAVLPWL